MLSWCIKFIWGIKDQIEKNDVPHIAWLYTEWYLKMLAWEQTKIPTRYDIALQISSGGIDRFVDNCFDKPWMRNTWPLKGQKHTFIDPVFLFMTK